MSRRVLKPKEIGAAAAASSDARNDDRTRNMLRETLSSNNKLRRNISLTNEDLFLLEYIRNYGLNAGIVRNYNTTIEHIKNFIERVQERNTNSRTSKVEVFAKVVASTSQYFKKEERDRIPYPYQFIKNKGMKISLVIAMVGEKNPEEIISLPFMVGCDWCPTSLDNHNPILNHQHGENIVDLRGYLLIPSDKAGCSPKYVFAHEKISHNTITTIKNDNGVYVTTLKIQDQRNNSVENILYRDKSDKSEEAYVLETSCLRHNPKGEGDTIVSGKRIKIKVNDLFTDIYQTLMDLKRKGSGLLDMTNETFVEKIKLVVAGSKISSFILYDFKVSSDTPFRLSAEEQMETKAKNLFSAKNKRMEYYTNNFNTLFMTGNFTEFMINAIFPSVAPSNNDNVKSRSHAYIGKAILLMRMLVANILTENQILEITDRNHVGLKVYMTAAETIRRDITRDNGDLIRESLSNKGSSSDKHYTIKANSSKGDINILEALNMGNMFDAIAQLTSLNTPRSTYSRCIEPRDVNASHTGYVCPSETPSTEKVGLVTHMACTSSFSSYKEQRDVENVVFKALEDSRKRAGKPFNRNEEFINIFAVSGTYKLASGKEIASISKSPLEEGKKLFSINSLPYGMITEDEFVEIKSALKTNPVTMDVAVIKETIKVDSRGEIILLSYNVLCDSGRLHRPLYRVDALEKYGFIDHPETFEQEHARHHSVEHFIRKGIIEQIFPIELDNTVICDKRSKLAKYLRDKKEAKQLLPAIEARYNAALGSITSKRNQLVKLRNESTRDVKSYEQELTDEEEKFEQLSKEYKSVKHTAEFTYEYCEIDPYALFGMVSSCAPMFNHNPGNRALHQSAMDKSLQSKISSNENMMTDTSAKKLHTTSQAAVTTKTNELFSRFIKNGENVIIGINIGTHNQEDAIILQENYAKSMVNERIITLEFTINTDKEKAGLPVDDANIDKYRNDRRYHAIDFTTGQPRLKAEMKEGDVIFLKHTETKIEDKELGESSVTRQIIPVFVQTGKEGYVSKISIQKTEGEIIYQVMLATMANIEYGDKVSSRYSQKSVVGDILKNKDMPYVDDPSSPLHGTILNAFFSSMSITSRGTAGLLHELMLGNLAVATGEVQDATAFTVNRDRMIEVNNKLMSLGYKPWCIERVMNPLTGTHIYTMVGVIHMRCLKHTAVDKQKACGMINHHNDAMTRQPTKGGPTGGSRLGYMDSNTLFGQNAAQLVNLLFKEQSSEVIVNICESCQHLNDRCNRDPATAVDTFASEHCTRCGEPTLREVSIPFPLKMIHDYLLPVGVKLDLFTT